MTIWLLSGFQFNGDIKPFTIAWPTIVVMLIQQWRSFHYLNSFHCMLYTTKERGLFEPYKKIHGTIDDSCNPFNPYNPCNPCILLLIPHTNTHRRHILIPVVISMLCCQSNFCNGEKSSEYKSRLRGIILYAKL